MQTSESSLIIHSQHPFNAEPPLDRLRANFNTPAADFYVRSHGSIPQLDAERHRLQVGGRVRTPLTLSMDALQGLAPPRHVNAVLQCAGNRRGELQQVAPTSGDPWGAGAIGHARWTGIPLGEVLRAAGSEIGTSLHVAFSCADEIDMHGKRFRFGVSIPMEKALHPEVLLAWQMNGYALRPEHGFPLRLVVPGYAGVRSPKWLTEITVQDKPSDNPMQQTDYKLLPPDVGPGDADPDEGIIIYEMPLNAAICEPAPNAQLPASPVLLRGYAVASGRRIIRVDVSIDEGRSWVQADLWQEADSPWSWTFWEKQLDLPKGEYQLALRAWDSAGQTQPSRPEDVWNSKGYLSAAWHRVPVCIE